MVFGGQMVREVEGLLLCVFWRRGDLKLRAYCFAAVKERRACLNLVAMGLSAYLAQSDPYPEGRPG